LRRLRALHEFAGAGAGRERRQVAGVERMEPKPVAPSPDYPAFVRIVPATYGVAFLQGLAVPEGLAVGRIVICRSGCVIRSSRRHGPVPASSVGQILHQALGQCFAGPAPAAGDAAGRRRCGAIPSALTKWVALRARLIAMRRPAV
jgi:hypothetical protein